MLALLAMPLTWHRIALIAAALAGFVLLFPVTAVRRFYKLELPHGALGTTLLIAALGAAALTGSGPVPPATPRPAEMARERAGLGGETMVSCPVEGCEATAL